MAKSTVNPQTLVDRLIEIDRIIKPLETEKEELKAQIRQFGPAAYNGEGGFVTVSAPSIRTKTGEKYVLNSDLFPKLTPQMRKKLLDSGTVTLEEIWSRASVAKVEVKVTK